MDGPGGQRRRGRCRGLTMPGARRRDDAKRGVRHERFAGHGDRLPEHRRPMPRRVPPGRKEGVVLLPHGPFAADLELAAGLTAPRQL